MAAQQRVGDGGKKKKNNKAPCLLQLKERDFQSRDLSNSTDVLSGRSCKLLDPFQGASVCNYTHARCCMGMQTWANTCSSDCLKQSLDGEKLARADIRQD